MTDSGDADCVPGSSSSSNGSKLSFSPVRSLPGRASGLSSPPPPGRLSSLRSRDLTLGGFKKPKKTFEPNFKAVRKSKDELREVHPAVKRDKRERDDKNRDSRARRRERPQIIQSHSIFEQGPADTIRRTAWRSATDLHDSTASPVAKHIKKERGDKEKDENELLCKLQRDDFIDDPGLRNDSKLRPIQLPLYQSSGVEKTEASVVTICKEDPPSLSADSGAWRPTGGRPPWRGAQSGPEPPRPEQPSVAELFQQLNLSGKEELFFIQLPDCMPGRPAVPRVDPSATHAPEKPSKKDTKSEDRKAQLKTHDRAGAESCPVLADFSEGLLGKLQIRKSGKVQLKLGDITMDVSEGAAFSFLQQLVSVRLSEGPVGDLSVLGNVHHKLVCSPDFHALLQDAPTQQPRTHR